MFDPTAVQAAPAPPRGPNPFALLAGIWFRPGRTLRVVAAGPAWLWILPFLIALVLSAGLAVSSGGGQHGRFTPAWLPIFAILFATLIGLISGVYPALRAATLDPLRALKYE